MSRLTRFLGPQHFHHATGTYVGCGGEKLGGQALTAGGCCCQHCAQAAALTHNGAKRPRAELPRWVLLLQVPLNRRYRLQVPSETALVPAAQRFWVAAGIRGRFSLLLVNVVCTKCCLGIFFKLGIGLRESASSEHGHKGICKAALSTCSRVVFAVVYSAGFQR